MIFGKNSPCGKFRFFQKTTNTMNEKMRRNSAAFTVYSTNVKSVFTAQMYVFLKVLYCNFKKHIFLLKPTNVFQKHVEAAPKTKKKVSCLYEKTKLLILHTLQTTHTR